MTDDSLSSLPSLPFLASLPSLPSLSFLRASPSPPFTLSSVTLFVLAYGMGPMILAPIQEVAFVGRNPVYIIGLGLFVIFQIPGILAKNITTILIFRFLSGFVGSPVSPSVDSNERD